MQSILSFRPHMVERGPTMFRAYFGSAPQGVLVLPGNAFTLWTRPLKWGQEYSRWANQVIIRYWHGCVSSRVIVTRSGSYWERVSFDFTRGGHPKPHSLGARLYSGFRECQRIHQKGSPLRLPGDAFTVWMPGAPTNQGPECFAPGAVPFGWEGQAVCYDTVEGGILFCEYVASYDWNESFSEDELPFLPGVYPRWAMRDRRPMGRPISAIQWPGCYPGTQVTRRSEQHY